MYYPATRLFILKNFFQGDPESTGDSEGKFERRCLFPLLKGDNGLPGAAGAVGQFFLCHLIMVEAQSANAVGYLGISHSCPFSSSR